MAEGLDLASKAVGEAPSTEEGSSMKTPPVTKTKAVKRKLVLKTERQKPQRVSQRCLGHGMAKKVGANTAADAVVVSSEGEEITPTKPAEESPPPTSQTDKIPPHPTTQEEELPTTPGEDLMDEPTKPVEEKVVDTPMAEPTTQEGPSSPEKALKDESEEERYQQVRKRKGKTPMQPKKSSKKPRMDDTWVVIRESERRTRQQRDDDSDYLLSEESDFESDVSLEDEEMDEHHLPSNHRELIHPPVERVVYRPWQVHLDDDLMEDMKQYNTQQLQDSFDDKEYGIKQIKCGKVLHLPSLDELAARESFLSYMRVLGFNWLLENRDSAIPVRLAK